MRLHLEKRQRRQQVQSRTLTVHDALKRDDEIDNVPPLLCVGDSGLLKVLPEIKHDNLVGDFECRRIDGRFSEKGLTQTGIFCCKGR